MKGQGGVHHGVRGNRMYVELGCLIRREVDVNTADVTCTRRASMNTRLILHIAATHWQISKLTGGVNTNRRPVFLAFDSSQFG